MRRATAGLLVSFFVLALVGLVGGASGAVAATAKPAIASLSPNTGGRVGGTHVTITGTGFTGATAVKFGAASATSFSVDSDTQITAVSPAAPFSSSVHVTVTTPNGTSGLVSGDVFTYVGPAVSGISPTSGPQGGGTSVTITGTRLSGATAVKFGTAAASSFSVDSDTQITATSPSSFAPGTAHVTVVTGEGTSFSTSADQFTYLAPPAITSLSPNTGGRAGGTSVTITGTGFTGATAVKFGGASATSFSVDSDTQITVTSPAAPFSSSVHVTVTTPNGTSGLVSGDVFTYVGPAVSGISPTSGPQGGGTSVTITGTRLTGATAVKFGSNDATSFSVDSDTQITATSPSSFAPGAVHVTVGTGEGTSFSTSADQFTYLGPPVITSLSPNTGGRAGGTSVTITGTGFTGATAVKFGGASASTFSVDSDTQITVTSPAAPFSSSVHVTVTTPNGTSGISSGDVFTYVGPAVSGISPTSGPQGGGTTVTITGTRLTGATAVKFGSNAATSFSVDSDTQITATSPSSFAPGTVHVTVVTGEGTSFSTSADQFTYVAPPVVSTVSPNTGRPSGGDTVTITGQHFSGATAVMFGSNAATSFSVDSDTQITAVSPAGSGIVHITVTTEHGGTSATGPADRYLYARTPTTLTAEAAVAQLSGLKVNLFGLKATLKDVNGHPIAGAKILFTAGSTSLCVATTDDTGLAKCNASASALKIVLADGYTATFFGDVDHLGSTDKAALIA